MVVSLSGIFRGIFEILSEFLDESKYNISRYISGYLLLLYQ